MLGKIPNRFAYSNHKITFISMHLNQNKIRQQFSVSRVCDSMEDTTEKEKERGCDTGNVYGSNTLITVDYIDMSHLDSIASNAEARGNMTEKPVLKQTLGSGLAQRPHIHTLIKTNYTHVYIYYRYY